jgi:two-component sensor histidine kinase
MATRTTSAAGLKPPLDWQRERVRTLSTAGGPHAPERVRAWLKATTGWLPRNLESALLLLTCELVNNSVLHGQAGEHDLIEIELRATATGLHAQVTDTGGGFSPADRRRELDEPGGWGLVLVERMAERWGVDNRRGTCVWFELAAT